MPKRFILEFRTEDGGWMDWGAYRRRLFARQPDGSYVCSGWVAEATLAKDRWRRMRRMSPP